MKIHVLCLGETAANYTADGNLTIGVNDVYKNFKTDYLVVVDPPERFTKDRLKTICKSNPTKFFTHEYVKWRPLVSNLQQIKLSSGTSFLDLDKPGIILHSNNSAFVACVIAYKLGATEIVIYGADFNTHPAFKDVSLIRAIQHFSDLYKELKRRGVKLYVSSADSKLSAVLPIR